MKHLKVPSAAAVLQVPTSTQNHNIHSLPSCYRALFLGHFSWYPPELETMFTLKEA